MGTPRFAAFGDSKPLKSYNGITRGKKKENEGKKNVYFPFLAYRAYFR
jgi:hypothetical protein